MDSVLLPKQGVSSTLVNQYHLCMHLFYDDLLGTVDSRIIFTKMVNFLYTSVHYT